MYFYELLLFFSGNVVVDLTPETGDIIHSLVTIDRCVLYVLCMCVSMCIGIASVVWLFLAGYCHLFRWVYLDAHKR